MRIFLTHIVPKGKEIETKASIAACNFSRNLMSSEIFDKIYSIPYVYIHCKFNNESNVEYICSKTRSWGRMFYKVAPIFEQIKLFFKIPKNSSLWLYNITTINELLFLLIRWFKPSVKIYTIVLDYTPGAKHNNRLLKKILASDGLITLSNNKLFNNRNIACIAGVVPSEFVDWPEIQIPIKKTFLLSGVLSEQISQISKILNVFANISNCDLHISGTLSDRSILEPYKKYTNIFYHEKVSWNDYLDLLHSCSFVLSSRNIHAPENSCNFPSKIIEALLHNRIIISTIKYTQLEGIKTLIIGNETSDMIHDITQIVHLSDKVLMTYANQSKKTKELFNVTVWNDTITRIENNN